MAIMQEAEMTIAKKQVGRQDLVEDEGEEGAVKAKLLFQES